MHISRLYSLVVPLPTCLVVGFPGWCWLPSWVDLDLSFRFSFSPLMFVDFLLFGVDSMTTTMTFENRPRMAAAFGSRPSPLLLLLLSVLQVLILLQGLPADHQSSPNWQRIDTWYPTSSNATSCPPHLVRYYVYEDMPPHLLNPLNSSYKILDMSIYAAEKRIHESSLKHPCRTFSPSSASFFFVPVFSSLIVNRDLHNSRANLSGGQAMYSAAHSHLLSRSPHYASSGGRDHVYVVSHDVGGCLLPPDVALRSVVLQTYGLGSEDGRHRRAEASDVEQYVLMSLGLEGGGATGEEATLLRRQSAERPPCFDARKDVAIPPFIGERHSLALDNFLRRAGARVGSGRDGARETLLHFRGMNYPEDRRYSQGSRQWLKDELLPRLLRRVDELAPDSGGALVKVNFTILEDMNDYWKELTSSAYCLCLPGWVHWSPRMYQAIAAGCIPIILHLPSEHGEVHLPFSSFLDYNSFSYIVTSLPALEDLVSDLLRKSLPLPSSSGPSSSPFTLPPEDVLRHSELHRVWRFFTYGTPLLESGVPYVNAVVSLRDGGVSDLKRGSLVEARFGASDDPSGGSGSDAFYRGVVAEVREDGTFDVAYDDGDFEVGVAREHIRAWGGEGRARTTSTALVESAVNAFDLILGELAIIKARWDEIKSAENINL